MDFNKADTDQCGSNMRFKREHVHKMQENDWILAQANEQPLHANN